jgi:hypothetical protein
VEEGLALIAEMEAIDWTLSDQEKDKLLKEIVDRHIYQIEYDQNISLECAYCKNGFRTLDDFKAHASDCDRAH